MKQLFIGLTIALVGLWVGAYAMHIVDSWAVFPAFISSSMVFIIGCVVFLLATL